MYTPGQPLVVQHPEKNVFSVSQRVPSIITIINNTNNNIMCIIDIIVIMFIVNISIITITIIIMLLHHYSLYICIIEYIIHIVFD